MIHISKKEYSYYHIKEYKAVVGGELIGAADPVFKSLDNGVYWTGTKISCGCQLAAIVKDNKVNLMKWDKTFYAKIVLKS